MSLKLLYNLMEVGLLHELLIRKDMQKLHAILKGLLEDGMISKTDHDELMYDIAELVWLDGDELKRKAEEIENKIEASKNEL